MFSDAPKLSLQFCYLQTETAVNVANWRDGDSEKVRLAIRESDTSSKTAKWLVSLIEWQQRKEQDRDLQHYGTPINTGTNVSRSAKQNQVYKLSPLHSGLSTQEDVFAAISQIQSMYGIDGIVDSPQTPGHDDITDALQTAATKQQQSNKAYPPDASR